MRLRRLRLPAALVACLVALPLAAQAPASWPMTLRVVAAAGATYIHQPSFPYVRGLGPVLVRGDREEQALDGAWRG